MMTHPTTLHDCLQCIISDKSEDWTPEKDGLWLRDLGAQADAKTWDKELLWYNTRTVHQGVLLNCLKAGLILNREYTKTTSRDLGVGRLLEIALYNPALMATLKMGEEMAFWEMLLRFKHEGRKLSCGFEGHIRTQDEVHRYLNAARARYVDYQDREQHTFEGFRQLDEQRKQAGLTPQLIQLEQGRPYLMSKIYAGKLEEAEELVKQGIRLDGVSEEDVRLYATHLDENFRKFVVLGRVPQLAKRLQACWKLALNAGLPSAFENPLNKPESVLVRAEMEAGHSASIPLFELLRCLSQDVKEWSATNKDERSPAKWMSNHGVSWIYIPEKLLQTVIQQTYSKAAIQRMYTQLGEVGGTLQFSPPEPVPEKDARWLRVTLLQSTLAKGVNDSRYLEQLHQMGVDFLKPVYMFDAPSTILFYPFLFSKKSNLDILKTLYDIMERQNPEEARIQLKSLHPKNHSTLMHWAARNFDLESMKWLQEKGLDIHAKDKHGNSVLHWTSKKYGEKSQQKVIPVVEWLIEQGIDLQETNRQKLTGFGALSKNAPIDALQVALEKNTTLMDAKDRYGNTPRDYLLQRRNGTELLPVLEQTVFEKTLPQAQEKPAPKTRRI